MRIKIFFLIFTIIPFFSFSQDKIETESSSSQKIRISYNVDEQAEPEGGFAEMLNKIGANLEYPAQARRNGTQGKVIIYLIIDSKGEVVERGIDTGIGNGCDEAVLKAYNNSGIKWKPAVKDGKKVNVKLKIPIEFKL